jgi:hypothetical protein
MATTLQARKAQTPFDEKAGGPARAWLNIGRFATLPQGHHPPRDRVQREVSNDEQKKGSEIIKRYIETEALAYEHDADRRQRDLDRLGSNGQHGFERARLRKEIEQCDMQVFLNAQTKLRELRAEAERLVVPILKRLIGSFDSELQQNALEEETRLQNQGFPILDEHRGTWMLHSFPIINALHARRESCRHLLNQFEIKQRGEELAIVTLQYVATADDVPANFSFLP